MNRTRIVVVSGLLAVGLAAYGLVGSALAGHTNTVLEADLKGRNEVATGATSNRLVGDPNGTGEIYVFGVDGDPTTLCYVLLVDKIQPATAAHIHEAGEGANGPVVVNLARPTDGNAADCLTEGETDPVTGAPRFVGGQTVAEILSNPEDYYVNVHNGEYPGGALRGQLQNQE